MILLGYCGISCSSLRSWQLRFYVEVFYYRVASGTEAQVDLCIALIDAEPEMHGCNLRSESGI